MAPNKQTKSENNFTVCRIKVTLFLLKKVFCSLFVSYLLSGTRSTKICLGIKENSPLVKIRYLGIYEPFLKYGIIEKYIIGCLDFKIRVRTL